MSTPGIVLLVVRWCRVFQGWFVGPGTDPVHGFEYPGILYEASFYTLFPRKIQEGETYKDGDYPLTW